MLLILSFFRDKTTRKGQDNEGIASHGICGVVSPGENLVARIDEVISAIRRMLAIYYLDKMGCTTGGSIKNGNC